MKKQLAMTMLALALGTLAGTVELVLPPAVSAAGADDLAQNFVRPPNSARPWVYWFWLNGNITREGITADLEAMRHAGVGGVLIMEVDQGAPVGPAAFMSAPWRELFQHVVAEAQRLGLEVNMNDDAGWNGSGGPWIKPEQSMQKVVWTETNLEGPRRFDGALPQPQTVAGFYRDLAVLAFPTTGPYRIDNIKVKASYSVGGVGPAAPTNLPPEMVIDQARLIELTPRMDQSGHLVWDVPAGNWTLLRFGHTSTGVENAPAPATGRGLECDKLSKEGIEANFAGMMGKLIADVGPAAGRTLVATHIDSWENGAQNWTARMREEFKQRRGYDPLPFFPALTGRVVGSLETSERFLWDLRQTVSDLVVENYAGRMQELAHQHGLRLSIEAYGGPCDDLPYAGRADEPMCEFWMGGGAFQTCKEMASAAHTYGKRILGAESFTAADQEKWLEHPATIKALGDRAFCAGVNRFVFHRYAMQPWTQDYRPGMTMGPWGLHYERTQTWWDWTPAWHEYLARCQFLLREGLFVADVCYLQPEAAPQGSQSHNPKGYDYDNCSAEVVLTRMTVKDGRLVLPDGMSYHLLVLPEVNTMTPTLLGRIKELVRAGATVVGPRPVKSPSLNDYPKCDVEVKQLADELWGDCDGKSVTEHRFGQGRVVWGVAPEKLLAQARVQPDFASRATLHSIHRVVGETDIYFVANPEPYDVETLGTFRVRGKQPEFWWPDTGRLERAAVFNEQDDRTSVLLRLGPSGSVFVVFRSGARPTDPITAVARDGKSILPASDPAPKVLVEKAVYGVPGDPQRTRDVRAKVQQLVEAGEYSFEVARLAQGDDPAVNIVKTLVVEYTVGGQRLIARGTDPDTIHLAQGGAAERVGEVRRGANGQLLVEAWKPGRYELTSASGEVRRVDVPALPPPLEVEGPWEVRFPPNQGAPEKVTLSKLVSWTEHSDPGVKYFSGAATYTGSFRVPREMPGKNRRLYLDLGQVQVMARVKVNGKDLGVLWKPPFRVDVTKIVKPGANALEVTVVNLWPNRMIGDEQLPEDSDRNPNGTLKTWPQWVQERKPSPAGRYTFTSWRLWKKDSRLLESGLLGPVSLSATHQVLVKSK
ncbi:MAG: glycosyl hydrolase [Limisphaerales bacterium]